MIQCRQLLNSDSDLIRKGDIYSLMIEYLLDNNDWNSASQLVMEMKKVIPLDNLTYYISKGSLFLFYNTYISYLEFPFPFHSSEYLRTSGHFSEKHLKKIILWV